MVMFFSIVMILPWLCEKGAYEIKPKKPCEMFASSVHFYYVEEAEYPQEVSTTTSFWYRLFLLQKNRR